MTFFSDTAIAAAVAALVTTIVCEILSPFLWGPLSGDPFRGVTGWLQRARPVRNHENLGMNVRLARAILIHAVNLMLIAVLCIVGFKTNARMVFVTTTVYVVFGAALNTLIRRVPSAEIIDAGWRARLWLRLFYAWWWPINAIATAIGLWRLLR